jgi:hypothetical protein
MTDLKPIAKNILTHLGGNRFIAMTGARQFIGGENFLMFSLPSGGGFTKKGINKVKITLMSSDTYSVEFSKMRACEYKIIKTCEDIYCDNLQDCFTRATGLETHL